MNKSARFLLHAFVLLAVTVAFAGERACEWTNVTRIVAVGDVHGDYGQLVTCLRNAGVITETNTWAGGKTHLVQTGDILDRGPSSKQAMDLLMALEPQAERAGGMVHPLLGNHEAMVLAGDYSYLDPHEADAYGGLDEFKKSMAAEGKYGQWIRGHQAIIRINDILFVHGGITGTQTNRSLAEINARAAAALGPRDVTKAGDSIEVLWCRDLALAPKADLESMLAPVFRKYDVRHVVIGHTVVKNPPRIKSRLQGAVILIDVGMSRTYRGGPAICLLIENGTFSAVSDEGKTEIETEAQGETFAQEGGFREKLTAIRTEARALEENAPVCPECGKPMKRRTAKAGSNAGHDFWGCTGYPACKGVRKIERPESTGTTGGENTANR